MTSLARAVLVLMAAVAAGTFVGLGWAIHYRASITRDQATYAATTDARQAAYARRNCLAIEKLKSYSEGAIKRAIKTLPTLAYYRAQPVELATQLADLKVLEAQFAPRACPRLLRPAP